MVEPVAAPVVEPSASPPVTPPVAPVAAPAVPPTDPPIYFGTDGVLNEGWQGTLEEDLREDKSLLSFKNVGDLAKSFVNTKKMVGQNVVAVLTDASSEGEIAEFHKAGGRPETVEDYGLKIPDGFPEDIAKQIFPAERLTKWQEMFFKGGVSKKAADAFIAEYAKDRLADHQTNQQAEEAAGAELVSGLATEYGAAYDQKLHIGDLAMEDFAGDNAELKESLAYLRKDPNAIRMLVHFGGFLAEGKPPAFGAIPTPSVLDDQIADLMANPLYMKGTKAERMKIAKQVMALREKKAANTA